MPQSAVPDPGRRGAADANGRGSVVPRRSTGRSRSLWLSLAAGLLAASVAWPSFTDPWPSNVGGFLFVVVTVTALLRGIIALGQAFLQGWREPRGPTTR